MSENPKYSSIPNLGKLSIAFLEHLVEPLLGDKAIGELRAPLEEGQLRISVTNALERTEKRFLMEYPDDLVRDAVRSLPLSNLPIVNQAVNDFLARPADPALSILLISQLTSNLPRVPEERIKSGVFTYLRILREELVSLSSDVREKLSSLATLNIEVNTERIASTLDSIREQIRSNQSMKLILPEIERDDLETSLVDINTQDVLAASEVALAELLALQYPWGEWSDRRTRLESIIAERESLRGPEGPKPNVARSLFALDVLDLFKTEVARRRMNLAMSWMTKDISEGWYWEWSSTQPLDSESKIPYLVKRKDVRHTAQLVSAFCRWKNSREPLASLLKSVVSSSIPTSGFWPETPGQSSPRLLASVYAIEAIGYAIAGRFRLSLDDLFDPNDVRNTRASLRRGLDAFLQDADRGDGLLGLSFQKPTPYLTGIALFRLAPLGRLNHEFQELVEKMVSGLISNAEETGWVDYTVPTSLRSHTRKRTTLRVAAGLGLAHRAGFTIPIEVEKIVVEAAQKYMLGENDLDSPDFACTLMCLLSFFEKTIDSLDLHKIESNAQSKVLEYRAEWLQRFQNHLSRLETGRRFGMPDYQELAQVFEERIRLLD